MEKKTSQEKDKTESCYIHIPFCKKICAYCDFCKMFYNKKQTSLYLEALEKEIDKYYKGEYQKTLYIGGGTPSSLELNELKNLFKIVKKISYDNNTEFTFECNINDISKELLELLKKNGVNRLSIGIESFNKKVLNILGRESSVSQISKKIDLAKEYFSNINIDLIYGVNGETLEDVKNDLIKFMKLNINHISIYSLILEDNTILKVNGYKEIDEDLNREMYDYIVLYLEKYGYEHYEISNFAKPGFYSKHNLNYWNNGKYYGFGLGSSGYTNNIRYTNTRSLNNYLKGNYRYEEEVINQKIDMENFMILGLRKTKGVSKKEFLKLYNKEIDKVFNVSKLKSNTNYYFIPKDKIYISNYILEDFINI